MSQATVGPLNIIENWLSYSSIRTTTRLVNTLLRFFGNEVSANLVGTIYPCSTGKLSRRLFHWVFEQGGGYSRFQFQQDFQRLGGKNSPGQKGGLLGLHLGILGGKFHYSGHLLFQAPVKRSPLFPLQKIFFSRGFQHKTGVLWQKAPGGGKKKH